MVLCCNNAYISDSTIFNKIKKTFWIKGVFWDDTWLAVTWCVM